MVKLFIYTLLAIVAALAVTLYLDIPNDPGYLLVAWRNYTFETSLFALIVFVALVAILLRLLILLVSWVNPWHLIRYGRRNKEIRQSKSRGHTVEGLMHFVRSNWQSAYNALTRSFRDDDVTVINYLAAAYAAFCMERKDLWTQCLDKASAKFPSSLSTINSLRGELLFRTNHLEQSLAILEQLKRTSTNDKHLLELLKEVYIKLEDWDRLQSLLPSLLKNNVVSEDEISRIEKRLFVEELYVAVVTQEMEKSATKNKAR
jgi:HemY protein